VIRHLVADDLTGAADASVHFASRREVVIHLPGAAPAAASLSAIDTETRGRPAAEAAAIVAEACRGLEGGVYMKVDSTLRGHLAAELEAARVALGRSAVVLAPSLPAQDRVVLHGRLKVGGIDKGRVLDLVGALRGLRITDAATDADLDRVAAACAADPALLPAGSAGLAAAFARLEGPPAAPPSSPSVTTVLVAVSSRQPASVDQARVARSAAKEGIEVHQKTAPRLAALVAERLAQLQGPVAIVATGGDGAFAICRELGIGTLRPRLELLPGLVLNETGRDGLWLATKAGGFGGPHVLLDGALKLLGSPDQATVTRP
jgi:D-threonate/D-erythronate kinase